MTKTASVKTVNIENLGLCEYCGTILNVEEMPPDRWQCPHCKGRLTNKSFGYRMIHGLCRKIQWVGKGGKWLQRRPAEAFYLNDWHIAV